MGAQRSHRQAITSIKSIEAAARSIAIVQAEFLLIHPFRDGNGRLIRLAANLMALQAGFAPMDYGFEDAARRETYIAAVRRGYVQDYGPLELIVRDAILRGEGCREVRRKRSSPSSDGSAALAFPPGCPLPGRNQRRSAESGTPVSEGL